MKENTDSLLQRIVEPEHGEFFYSFVNAEGKRWLLSAKSRRTAISIYQPGSCKGRMLKVFFPYLFQLPFIGLSGCLKSIRLSLDPVLQDLLEKTYSCTSPDFSIFCGTPSANPKITIQISKGKKVLGYCKLTDKPEIAELFFHEQGVLDELLNAGIGRIPECLYCGKLNNDIWAFAQSSDRTEEAVVSHRFTTYHRDFLEELYFSTKRCFLWEETDFAQSLEDLGEYTNHFLSEDRILIWDAVRTVERFYRADHVEFSMYHGDFTPWNTFVAGGKLYAFDFEYACRSCPPYMDACHFISETARLELKMDPVKAFRFFCWSMKRSLPEVKDPGYLYLGYLLYTLSFYFRLYNGRFDTDDKGYAYWVGLIRIITDKTNGNKTK